MNVKLEQIQELARKCNAELSGQLGEDFDQRGGCLFLGNHYADRPRMFFGLNPGKLADVSETGEGEASGDSFCVDLIEESWDSLKYSYWKNFCLFLDSAQGLREWMEDATATYCLPWRTKDGNELRKLDRQTGGKLSELGGKLFRQMIAHHRDNSGSVVLIVAGVESLQWIKSKPFLGFDVTEHTVESSTRRGTYQWRKIALDNITIYQLPHFSRANSRPRLSECANWLAGHLGGDRVPPLGEQTGREERS